MLRVGLGCGRGAERAASGRRAGAAAQPLLCGEEVRSKVGPRAGHRLRDLAGLIVIDFIDLRDTKNKRKVERALKSALKDDKARHNIGRIGPFGLLELSRHRLQGTVVSASHEPCPGCRGSRRSRQGFLA